jgi:hypothetical protein
MYIEESQHELEDAADGLMLAMRVFPESNLYLYLYTQASPICLAAEDALKRDQDGENDPVSLPDVAVAIQCTGDTLTALRGSGLKLHNETFAYRLGEDASRTLGLSLTGSSPTIRFTDCSAIALSDAEDSLPEFLDKYASPPTNIVERTSPGTGKQSSIDSFLKGR